MSVSNEFDVIQFSVGVWGSPIYKVPTFIPLLCSERSANSNIIFQVLPSLFSIKLTKNSVVLADLPKDQERVVEINYSRYSIALILSLKSKNGQSSKFLHLKENEVTLYLSTSHAPNLFRPDVENNKLLCKTNDWTQFNCLGEGYVYSITINKKYMNDLVTDLGVSLGFGEVSVRTIDPSFESIRTDLDKFLRDIDDFDIIYHLKVLISNRVIYLFEIAEDLDFKHSLVELKEEKKSLVIATFFKMMEYGK